MPNDAKTYICDTCSRAFKRKEHLVRHVRTHTREKPFPCPLCDRSFARQDILKRHIQSHNAATPSVHENALMPNDGEDWRGTEVDWLALVEGDHHPASNAGQANDLSVPRLSIKPINTESPSRSAAQPSRYSVGPASPTQTASQSRSPWTYDELTTTMKLPPELYNNMVDDAARRWLRDICEAQNSR